MTDKSVFRQICLFFMPIIICLKSLQDVNIFARRNIMLYEKLFEYIKSLSPEEFACQIKNGTFAEKYIEQEKRFTFVKAR